MRRMSPRARKLLAWSVWLASLGCCAAGLVAAVAWVRPLTLGLLATGAGAALAFPLGYATVGLVLSLRRPASPIGWLYAASGLVWSLVIPFEPWGGQLLRDHDALAGELLAVVDQTVQPTRAWLWLRPPAAPRPPQ
jgi:MFS family permease